MRDHLRELDLEQATGATNVRIDVDDRGLATVTLQRDALDKPLSIRNSSHWGCRSEADLQAADSDGYSRGWDAAIDKVRALAPKATA